VRRHPSLVLILAALLLPAIIHTPRAIAVERPPPLAAQSGCELWIGRASGNDPSWQVELELCPRADNTVSGSLQWSSTVSGWNTRTISGRFEQGGAVLIMRDERITAERPEPGWMFCTVDRYTLSRSRDQMQGRYHSGACRDDGTISLARSTTTSAQPGTGPGPLPNTPPVPEPPSRPTPRGTTPPSPRQPPSGGPFGCSV
jgi:hypothetical protein